MSSDNSQTRETLKSLSAGRKAKAKAAREAQILAEAAELLVPKGARVWLKGPRACEKCGETKEERFFPLNNKICKACHKANPLSLEEKARRHRLRKLQRQAERKLARTAAARRRRAARKKELVARQVTAVEREMAARELARRRLIEFVKRFHPRYLAGWVHEDICRRLERFSHQVTEGKSPRLILLLPPRSGKSELASIQFNAWHLGHHPEHEIINVGYGIDLPVTFSRRIRDILRDPAYMVMFDQTRLASDSQAVEQWHTTAGGGFTAVGRGGGITGKGAHILEIDDPLKNWEEADSQAIRDALWDWYLSTAYTRLAPGGGILIIETWWHDDDLVGRLLELARSGDPHAERWEVVKYPALAVADEYLTEAGDIVWVDPDTGQVLTENVVGFDKSRARCVRRRGDALHPERYDEVALQRIKATLSPRLWSALYQQNPIPDEGAIFTKSIMRWAPSVPGENVYKYQTWDFAITEKQTSDWTVGSMTVQDSDDNLYLHPDVVRFRESDGEVLVDAILDYYVRHGADVIGVEDGQIWKALRATFEKRCRERKLYPMVELLKPITDKVARARPLQGRMQLGKYYLPENAPLRDTIEREFLRFPGGTYDDIVDSAAWGAQLAVGKQPPRAPVRKKLKSWKDRLHQYGALETTYMAA